MGVTTQNTVGNLGERERAVLAVLVANCGKVVSRGEISRRAGLGDCSARRCDSLLVDIRRHLGVEAIRTVRSRGWLLEPAALSTAESLLQSPS